MRYKGRDLRYRVLFDVLRRHCNGSVLDAGGGSFVTKAMGARVSFTGWTIVEPSAASLPAVPDSRVERVIGDGCALGFPDACFDTVVSIQVLEHVFEPIRMIEELYRVARPGAPIVLMVPQTANLHHAPHHYQNFTRYWLEASARQLGAEIVEYHALGGGWSTTASRLLLQYPASFGVGGYAHPGVRRGWKFWALFPLGVAVSLLTIPLAMLLSLGDLEEEANNHLIVLRRPAEVGRPW